MSRQETALSFSGKTAAEPPGSDGSGQPGDRGGRKRPVVEAEIKQFLLPGVSYMHVLPPSLTKQRNEGIKALDKDITLAGYLDDDILLEQDAVEAMLRFWEYCADDIGGSNSLAEANS